MNSNKDNAGYFSGMPVYDGRLTADLNSDFTLPDYQSEIRRLLGVRAQIAPEGDYLGNGNAELSGKVIYKATYVGADGELYCVPLSESYSFSLPFDLTSHAVSVDDVTVFSQIRSESVSARVLGPRKLSVKSKLSCKALALTPMLHTPEASGAIPQGSLEHLMGEADSLVPKRLRLEPLTLNDTLPLDQSADNVRAVTCDSVAIVNDCSASGGRVRVSGEVILKILYCNDAESDYPLCATRKLPFSASAYCEDADTDCDVSADVYITDEQILVDDNGISSELILSAYVNVRKNERVPFVADAYSTDFATESIFKDVQVMSALKSVNGNLTQNELRSLDELKLPHGFKIIDVFARARADELLTSESGRLSLCGECTYFVLCFCDDEYLVKELSFPFRYELDSRYTADTDNELHYCADACAVSARARHDGERLFIDGELNILISLEKKKCFQMLSKISAGDRLVKSSGAMTLCYPDKGESLWSVAKRYGEPISKLKKQNSLPDDDISKKKYLVI